MHPTTDVVGDVLCVADRGRLESVYGMNRAEPMFRLGIAGRAQGDWPATERRNTSSFVQYGRFVVSVVY
jgi:hypothetical protein